MVSSGYGFSVVFGYLSPSGSFACRLFVPNPARLLKVLLCLIIPLGTLIGLEKYWPPLILPILP